MRELERIELAIRRVRAGRQEQHEKHGATLNIDVQDLLRDLADEIAKMIKVEAP